MEENSIEISTPIISFKTVGKFAIVAVCVTMVCSVGLVTKAVIKNPAILEQGVRMAKNGTKLLAG